MIPCASSSATTSLPKARQPARRPTGTGTDHVVVHHVRGREHAHAALAQSADVAQVAIEHVTALNAQQDSDRAAVCQAALQISDMSARSTSSPDRLGAPASIRSITQFGDRHARAQPLTAADQAIGNASATGAPPRPARSWRRSAQRRRSRLREARGRSTCPRPPSTNESRNSALPTSRSIGRARATSARGFGQMR